MDIENLLGTLKMTDIPSCPITARLTAFSYRLRQLYSEMEELAVDLDYPGVPYNGLRTLMKIIRQMVPIVIETIQSSGATSPSNGKLQSVTNVVELFKNIAETMVHQAKRQLENDPDRLENEKKFDIFLNNVSCWWQFAKRNQRLFASYFSDHMLFYLDPSLRMFIVNCTQSMVSLRTPMDTVACLMNPAHRGQLISDLVTNGSLYYPLKVWAILDNPVFNGISSWQANKFNVSTQTIHVPRQHQWIIPTDGRPIQDQYKQSTPLGLPLTNNSPVRCRLLRSKKYHPNGKLVIHISGGGFVMFKPEINEGCYLRYWAGNLSGTTLLSIDYTKLVVYPKAFQEVLDVYLWASSGQDDAIQMLGFRPQEVVLCGDSAGSHLAFAVCRALQDIRNGSSLANNKLRSTSSPSISKLTANSTSIMAPFPFDSKTIPTDNVEHRSIGSNEHDDHDGLTDGGQFIFPSAFVSFYSNMSIAENQCSLGLTCLEAALTPSVILSLYGLIASGLVMDEDEEIDGLAEYSTPNTIRDNWRTWLRHGKNWFNCEPDELVRRFDTIRRNTCKAYLRPMTDEDLTQLKELRLFLICGEFDFFLDGCINLAKAWRGPVQLDVVENVGHGFLSYSKISKECRQGSRLGLKRLKEALNL